MLADARLPQAPPADSARQIDPVWAWAPYRPDANRPWDHRRAGHLFRRAGFGADWKELERTAAEGPEKTLDRLLAPDSGQDAFDQTMDNHEAASLDPSSGSAEVLCQWWLRRMITTPKPLAERMTLFWHNYFGTSNVRVGNGSLLRGYFRALRRDALGKFPSLMQAISQDPASLLALEAATNRKAQPNENFARALVEQYTVGPGESSPADVRETARALTGWFVLRGQLRFIEREHDPGSKKILGREGNWKSDDAVRILAEHPATVRRIVRRLYREFVSEVDVPNDALLAPLSGALAKDFDVGGVVATMLRSNLFFAPSSYRQRVKSPVEYALGIARAFEVVVPTQPLERDLAALGQDLAQPPTIRGWPGAKAWINNFILPRRNKLAAALLAGSGPYGGKLDPLALTRKHGASDPEAAARFFLDLLLQNDLEPNLAQSLAQASEGGTPTERLRALVQTLVTLPEFHLA